MSTKLSIIVPVYNVEKYIRSCIESIFKQGLDDADFELIIVNDGTKDHSMEMIADIIQQHNNITVINQENLSLSVARNNGIAIAKGEYILMPDSDDLLIENSLKPLLDKALETKVDLVVADYLMMNDEEIDNFNPPIQKEFKMQEKIGRDIFLFDYNPYESYVWRTLYRRCFLIENDIWSYPGIRFQDVPFTHECYLKAKKCIKAQWLLNIYRTGHNSATLLFNKQKAKDFCIALKMTWKLRNWDGHTLETLFKLENDVFISFSYLISLISYSFKSPTDRKITANFLKEYLADITFRNGIKQKTISFFFRTMPYCFIEFNYYLRVLYRLVK